MMKYSYYYPYRDIYWDRYYYGDITYNSLVYQSIYNAGFMAGVYQSAIINNYSPYYPW